MPEHMAMQWTPPNKPRKKAEAQSEIVNVIS
jgi:hypothetical protein